MGTMGQGNHLEDVLYLGAISTIAFRNECFMTCRRTTLELHGENITNQHLSFRDVEG